MPRIALVCLSLLLGACSFDADYSGGNYLCTGRENSCPLGLECRTVGDEKRCLERSDAAIDALDDAMPDARKAALNCADPGVIPPTGGGDMDTTVGRTPKVAPMCNGTVMTAVDAVYRITPGAGKQMLVDIATTNASFSVTAYVTTACPSTACLTNMYAFPGNPISVTTLAGDHYIVVDSGISADSGPYTLAVTIN